MGNEGAKAIATYRDLRVFQRGYELALKIHKVTQKFPAYERRELGSQLRRAATSIPIQYSRRLRPEAFRGRFQTLPRDRNGLL